MNLEDLKDGLLDIDIKDITKDGEPGIGEEPTEDIGQDIVGEFGGGQDAEITSELNGIITDTTTGLEPGDTDMFLIED